MQRFPSDEVDVLVVGEGAAGLAIGLTLGELGITALVVERRPNASAHPRATALTAATMELMRDWGIEPEVRQAGFVTQPVLSLRSCLVGPELDRIPMNEHVWSYAQDRLEPILCERTRSAGTLVVYGWEVTQVQTSVAGVRSTLINRATGASSEIRARFLVGADGAWSRVRSPGGIRVSRSHSHGDWISMLFRSLCERIREIRHAWSMASRTRTRSESSCPLIPRTGGFAVFPGTLRPESAWRTMMSPPVPLSSGSLSAFQRFPSRSWRCKAFGWWRPLQTAIGRAGCCSLVMPRLSFRPAAAWVGLNIALQDGVTATHCLAQAIKDGEAPDTLEAYEAERRPVAERLLASDLADPYV